MRTACLLLAFCLTAVTQEIPTVNADAGPCHADFTVTDVEGKTLYNAKVKVVVRHGVAGLRKTEVEVGTDANGRARIAGLPRKSKKPLRFEVVHGGLSRVVKHDPVLGCEASYPVILKAPGK